MGSSINSLYPLIVWSCKVAWQTKIIISTTRVFMATKLDRIITYFDGLPLIYSTDPLITWSYQITWQTKNYQTFKVMTHHEEHPLEKLHNPSVKWFCEVTWHQILYISTCNRSLATKHGNLVALCEGISPINSHNPLNMCSQEITYLIKNIKSPLS